MKTHYPASASILSRSSARELTGARVLVWGALGLIGFHITEALLAAGAKVSVLCRNRGAYPEPRWASQVHWHELGAEGTEAVLLEAVAAATIIVNLAGSSGAVSSNVNPLDSLAGNCRVQLEFLQACQRARHKPHVIFASSRLVYGPTNPGPVSEEHTLSPRSVYAAHKLCVEHYLHLYSCLDAITYTVCRISNAYGPDPGQAGRGYKILNSFITRSLAGLPITLFGTGEQIRDFIYVQDLADVLLRCCISPGAVNQIFNIGSGEGCRLVDAAELVRRFAGGPPLVFQPWPQEYLAVESGDYVSDIGKANRLLDLGSQYSITDGILKTIDAYQSEQNVATTKSPAIREVEPALSSLGNREMLRPSQTPA